MITRPTPTNEEPHRARTPIPPRWRAVLRIGVLLVVVFMAIDMWSSANEPQTTSDLTYTEFLAEIDKGAIVAITLAPDGLVDGLYKDAGGIEVPFSSHIPIALEHRDLEQRLSGQGVEITAVGEPGSSIISVLIGLSPLLLLAVLWIWLSRRATGMSGAFGSIGRSKAKVIDAERPTTRFADVAGYEGVKEELREIVDFLMEPERFRAVGATGPRGALMIGPPGTGKTLIARAVAGEASVPVFSVSGSAFVEMFVGVGAARVRDLFEQARNRAPAIIFVDEIDAIGQRRGGGNYSNDEREQTLNQLLAEMDGFDPSSGIVVLAATNRPDVLDSALLRPGRFDRQIVVPLPNLAERRAILGLHCENKPIESDVDLDAISRATPGFSGADLANLANEAAIFAVRNSRTQITKQDFDDARTRIVLGRREGSNILLPAERRSIAVHEAGHALVAALSDHTDPVSSVTILPAGQSLGATEQLPIDERHLYTESFLLASLNVRLGGRAAELVVFGEGSTGASDDLARATEIATRMVREYGLSRQIGPVGYPTTGSMYVGSEPFSTRTYSEETQRAIDKEVARMVGEAESVALQLLRNHREELDRLTRMLLDRETVAGDAVYRLIARPNPSQMVNDRHPNEELSTSAPSAAIPSNGTTPTASARATAAFLPEEHPHV